MAVDKFLGSLYSALGILVDGEYEHAAWWTGSVAVRREDVVAGFCGIVLLGSIVAGCGRSGNLSGHDWEAGDCARDRPGRHFGYSCARPRRAGRQSADRQPAG